MALTPAVRLRIGLWVLFLGGGALAGGWLDRRLFAAWAASPLFHWASGFLGLMVMAGVFRVSRVTGRTLARYGRAGTVPRLETNRLVTRGPYACMRHPMHFALLFMPLGLALILGSPGFILLIAPVEALVMLALIFTLEEREALSKFGEAYAAYRRRVPAFALRPSCLRRLWQEEPAHGQPPTPG